MKTFINTLKTLAGIKFCLLVTALLFNSLSWAAPKAREFSEQVGIVTYSLENVKNEWVINHINDLDHAAGKAMTIDLAAQIAERFQTGLQLLKVIIMDPEITKEEKRPLVENLTYALTQIIVTVARQHGKDELDPTNPKHKKILSFIKRSIGELGTAFGSFASFPVRERVLSLDEQAQLMKDPHSVDLTKSDGRSWNPLERMIRDLLLQEMGLMTQKIVAEVGTIEGQERADDFFLTNISRPPEERQDDWADRGAAGQILGIRQARLTAHRSVFGLLGGFAALWMLVPVDFVGMATVYTDRATVMTSDMIALGFLGALALFKQATGSYGSIPIFETLVDMAEHPEVPKEFSALKLPLLTKIFRLKSRLDQARLKVTPLDRKEELADLCRQAVKGNVRLSK